MTEVGSRRIGWWVGGSLLLGVAAGTLFLVDPAQARWFPRCLFQAVTGWTCPGCGSSRALHALAHGQVGTALGLNPLLFFLLPVMLYGAINPSRISRISPAWVWGLLGIIMVFGVARNISAYPFTLLTP